MIYLPYLRTTYLNSFFFLRITLILKWVHDSLDSETCRGWKFWLTPFPKKELASVSTSLIETRYMRDKWTGYVLTGQIEFLWTKHEKSGIDVVLTKQFCNPQLLFETRKNTVSNAHKMIPPAPPWFVFAYFTVGNLKINQIKMYNRMWGMSLCNI